MVTVLFGLIGGLAFIGGALMVRSRLDFRRPDE